MVGDTQRRIQLGAPVSGCFSHLFILLFLLSSIGLVIMIEGTVAQTLVSWAVSLRGGGWCSQVLEERYAQTHEEKDGLSQEAPGGLERNDSICSDVQLQIFVERKRGKAGKDRLILLFGSRCYSDRTSARVTILINSCPVEGLERGNFYKIISAVG